MVKDTFGNDVGLGRIAELSQETTLDQLAAHVKQSLGLKEVRYSGDLQTKIKKVALCGGSGMSFWQGAKAAGCDVYITGDIKYGDALTALGAGLCLLDITHYSGENIIVEAIVDRLRAKAAQTGIVLEINATSIDGQPFHML
jgi:putative NIF3 family GTP cyclohydrolase 1 type 2